MTRIHLPLWPLVLALLGGCFTQPNNGGYDPGWGTGVGGQGGNHDFGCAKDADCAKGPCKSGVCTCTAATCATAASCAKAVDDGCGQSLGNIYRFCLLRRDLNLAGTHSPIIAS